MNCCKHCPVEPDPQPPPPKKAREWTLCEYCGRRGDTAYNTGCKCLGPFVRVREILTDDGANAICATCQKLGPVEEWHLSNHGGYVSAHPIYRCRDEGHNHGVEAFRVVRFREAL